MKQTVKIKSPIKVIPSENYLLVIEDANGVRHYWHNKHNNEYGVFQSGEYDGWSKEIINTNDMTTKRNVPKRDGSGQGTRQNKGRGGCDTPKQKPRRRWFQRFRKQNNE